MYLKMQEKTYVKHFKDNYRLDLAYNALINQNEIFENINDEEISNNYEKEEDNFKKKEICDIFYNTIIKWFLNDIMEMSKKFINRNELNFEKNLQYK